MHSAIGAPEQSVDPAGPGLPERGLDQPFPLEAAAVDLDERRRAPIPQAVRAAVEEGVPSPPTLEGCAREPVSRSEPDRLVADGAAAAAIARDQGSGTTPGSAAVGRALRPGGPAADALSDL